MSEQQNFEQILDELKALRQEKGIRLEELAKRTKIKLRYFELLEAGQLEQLPRVYDRFIFRSYLEGIGAQNIPQLMHLYDQKTGNFPGTSTIMRTRKKAKQSERRLLFGFTAIKLIYIIFPVLFILLLLFIFMKNYHPDGRLKNGAVKELTAMDIVQKTQALHDQEKESNEIDSLEINITAHDKCWLLHIEDHADTNEVMLYKNNNLRIRADSVVEMRIGNPAVLTLQLNDQKFDSLTAPGEVISYLKITKNGITKKIIKKPKIKGKAK